MTKLGVGDLVKNHLGFIFIIIDIEVRTLSVGRTAPLYCCWAIYGAPRRLGKLKFRRWNLTLFRKKNECQAD